MGDVDGPTPALVALHRTRVAHHVHRYELGSGGSARPEEAGAYRHGYGVEAAAALGVAPERVFKTLVTRAGDDLVLAAVPASASLDLKALAAALGAKRARMCEPAEAERATGYVVGGISPLGARRNLPLVLDTSAAVHDTIYVSAGRRGLQVELAAAALLQVTGGRTEPIARTGRP